MKPVDLDRLRALYDAARGGALQPGGLQAWEHNKAIWLGAISHAAPAMMDELESLRGEVERLRTTQAHPGYVAAHNLANKAMDSEREAIVAWLRDCAEYDMADAIERGDHLAGEENP